MADVTEAIVETKLKEYIDPFLEKDLVSSKMLRKITIEGDQVLVDVVLGFPAKSYQEELAAKLKSMIESIDGVSKARANVSFAIQAHS
ncbi:MAG: iron-sulfur cluster assembly protein, partial [Gammaproteobacteria bacterium]